MIDISSIAVGDIITYKNGVVAPVIYVDYDDDPSIQKYMIRTPAYSAQYCDAGFDSVEDGWKIIAVDSTKRPLTIYEWAKQNPEDANLLCCRLGKVVKI